MRPIRVLWLKQRFHPEPSPLRGLDLAQALAAHGIEIEVATGFPYYPGESLHTGYKQSAYHRNIVDGITVHRNPGIIGHSSSAFRRAASYATMPASAYINSVRKGYSHDLVLATLGPGPYATAGQLIARRLGCPLVLDVQDLWPESLVASGMWPARLPTAPIEALLSKAYRAATAIICLSDGCREELVRRGASESTTHTVLNWSPDAELSDEQDAHDEAKRIVGSALDGYFCYTGALGPIQGIDEMIGATVAAGPSARLVIAGSGRDEARLREVGDRMGNGQVQFVGQQPLGVARALSQNALANVLHLAPSGLDQTAIPSKFSGYLAAARPVVVAAEGETARIANRVAAGPVCAPQQVEPLADAFRQVLNADADQRRTWSKKAMEFASQHMSFDEATRSIADVIRHAASVNF